MGSIADRILELSTAEISPDYLTVDDLREYADDPDRHLIVYDLTRSEPVWDLTDSTRLEETDREILGFALTGTFHKEQYDRIVSVPVEEILLSTPLTETDFPISHFKVMVVDERNQGKGIGSAMAASALAPLLANPPVTAMLWERKNPANIKLAERYANNQLARFENYFPPEWRCPVCGFDNDCDCAITMYGWFADERSKVTTTR